MRSLRPARRHRRHRPAPWKSGGIARPASAPVRVKPNSWSGCAPERAGARRPSDKICSAGTSNSAADRGRQRRPPIAHILPIVIVAKDLASLDASGDAMLQYAGCFRKGASRHGCRLAHLGPVVSSLDSLTSLSIACAEHMALRQVWTAWLKQTIFAFMVFRSLGQFPDYNNCPSVFSPSWRNRLTCPGYR